MKDTGLGKYTTSFGLSLAITSVLSALLVVLKELNTSTVLAGMKGLTSHHWITHGIFDVVVFVVLGWLLARVSRGEGLRMGPKSLILMIVVAVVISGLIISGFYLIEG